MTMKHTTRWREFEKGDLVQVTSAVSVDPQGKVKFSPMGIVLESFDSNVYESASCNVLVDGRVEHHSTRRLKLIKENQK